MVGSIHCPLLPVEPLRTFGLPVQPRSILVTGGAGYIGSHTILLLLQQTERYEITIIDNMSRGNAHTVQRLEKAAQELGKPPLHFVQSELTDFKSVYAVLEQYKVDTVIHFAAFAYAGESVQRPLVYFENVAESTRVLLTAMEASEVTSLIYSSSSATYGTIEKPKCDIPIRENSPQKPISPYGQAKLHGEQMIMGFAVKQAGLGVPFSFAALRYFNVIGADPKGRAGALPKPELSEHGRIIDACFDVADGKKEKMHIFGGDYDTADGTAVRDFIHVSDLAEAHLKVLLAVNSPGNHSLVYNVGIGKGRTALELMRAVEIATGKKVPYTISARREGDPPVVIGDSSRIVAELGWQGPLSQDLIATVKSAWDWRLQHQHEA